MLIIVSNGGIMNEDKLNRIEELMDELKVISYDEHDVMCNSSFIKIKSGEYRLNNGKCITRERVTKRSNGMDAVVIFAINTNNEIIMVVQPRVFLPTDKKVTIEMPAGYIDSDEGVIDAGKRELLEETGYSSDKFYVVDKYYPSLGYSGESISILLAYDCLKKSDQDLDEDEFVNYFEVSLDELEYLINNNYIIDATTKLAYYEGINYLKKNNLLDVVGGSNV